MPLGKAGLFTSLLSNNDTKKPIIHQQPRISMEEALAKNSAFVHAQQANACKG